MAGNQQPGWRGAESRRDPRGGPNWKQDAAPARSSASTTRLAKLTTLALAGTTVTAAVVYFLLFWAGTKHPALIALAANPDPAEGGAVTNLDVPYDPAGFASAEAMLRWADQIPRDNYKLAPTALVRTPHWIDDPAWLDAVANREADPVVVYVGLPGSVDRDGEPFLFTGRAAPAPQSPLCHSDRPAVLVSNLVTLLRKRAGSRRVVLVLDSTRALPDPIQGEVNADFTRAVEERLASWIDQDPNLVVLLGAADGQRAWDAPDRGVTALAAALLDGLAGGNGELGERFETPALAAYVQASVQRWSRNNRPSVQAPVLLPAESSWSAERRARFQDAKFYSAPPATLEAVLPLPAGEFEADCAALAARVPAPETYTPLAWRWYRELVLRHELAADRGDRAGAAALAEALGTARKTVEAGLALRPASTEHALPLARAVGAEPLPGRNGATWIRTVERAASLESLVANLPETPPSRRPIEWHLPVMLRDFTTTIYQRPETVTETWRPAVLARARAEQAAFGTWQEARFPYTERLWPRVREAVLAADEARLRGEDLAISGESAASTAALTEALQQYQATQAVAEVWQAAWAAHDAALADLPFLSRWAAETQGETADMAEQAVLKLWAATHTLSGQLGAANPPPAAELKRSTTAVTDNWNQLRGLIADSARAVSERGADTQATWQNVRDLLLLPPPLVPRRAELIERARRIESVLAGSQTAAAEADPRAAARKVVRRANLAAESLSGAWWEWANSQSGLVKPNPDEVSGTTATLTNTAKFTAIVAAHRRAQANLGNEVSADPKVELLSRFAAPFVIPLDPEPAAAVARARWQSVFTAQARRAARDHWYNEEGQPYMSGVVAQKFLADAAALAAETSPSPDATAARAAMAAPPLALTASETGPVVWTTERERPFNYTLTPADYPVAGQATVWWTPPGSPLALDNSERRRIPLGGPIEPLAITARLTTPDTPTGRTEFAARAYFRGQRNQTLAETTVKLNGRPDLVLTDPPPPRGAALAVRADLSPGAVSVLVDFSGSMTKAWGGKASKKDTVVGILADIRNELPPDTQLTVRVMDGNNNLTDTKSEVLTGDFVSKLRNRTPAGLTPLLPCIQTALETDFATAGRRAKTLIVLTDGADTSQLTPAETTGFQYVEAALQANRDELIKRVNQRVLATLSEQDVTVQMVVFGTDVNEETLAREMFRPIESFTRNNAGSVYISPSPDDLKTRLFTALRPRVRLLNPGGSRAMAAAFAGTQPVQQPPPSGLPTDPTGNRRAEGALRRWGPFDPRAYSLLFQGEQQTLQLDRGDALCVKVTAEQGGTQFTREVYYREVNVSPAEGRTTEKNGWFAAVPSFGFIQSGRFYFAATAALENARPEALRPGSDGVLTQPRPRLAWWEVARLDGDQETPYPMPLTVRPDPAAPAPSWRLVADHGATLSGLSDRRFRLNVWPLEFEPPSVGAVRVTRSQISGANHKADLNGTDVRVALEAVPFALHPGDSLTLPGGPPRCLVVRIRDPLGRRLRVRVPKLPEGITVQHQYFFEPTGNATDRPGIAAQTVLFGPVTDDQVESLGEFAVELASVSEILASQKPLAVDLSAPKSAAGPSPQIQLLTLTK